MNRLKEFFEEPREPESPADYYCIETHSDCFLVSGEVAAGVVRQLEQRPSPRWLVFSDLFGRRHRVLAACVYLISESTTSQRAALRQFRRARKLEEKADRRPWEDDD